MRLMVVLAIAIAASAAQQRRPAVRCDVATAMAVRVGAPCIREDVCPGGIR